MKVLQINAVYGKSSTGNIMTQIQECSRSHGIDAHVAFPKGFGISDSLSYEIGSTIDHKVHAAFSRIAGKQAYYSKCATNGLLRYLDYLKPDIVHLHNLHSNYINLNMLLIYLAVHDVATVVTMHDCWYFTGGCFHYANAGCDKWQYGCGHCPKKMQDSKAYLLDKSASILNDRAKYLNAIPRLVMVGCSEWVANECKKSVLRNKEIRFIHNGFDLGVFHPVESNWRKRLDIEDKFVILCPASKWFSDVNKATYDYFVNNMTEDMVLVLFGCKNIDGNLQKNVKQIGFICESNEMARIYSMADVMVNCSREDTLSSLNLEAQACGTPVVTYEATGSKETVDGKCSFAVETGNAAALFEKVLLVREHRKENLQDDCIRWISANYEMKSSYEKYVNLYRNIV